MIKLDIVSDPICPWCYIGKARLNQALETAVLYANRRGRRGKRSGGGF